MSFLPVWIQAPLEALLCRDLAAKTDNASLNKLLAFTAAHQRPFPIDQAAVRHALFTTKSWRAEKSRQEMLFSIVEAYLLAHIQDSEPGEWQTWIHECRELGHPIHVTVPGVAQAIREAYTTGKFADLPPGDLDYLISKYYRAFPMLHEQLRDVSASEALPVLLEYSTMARRLEGVELAAWLQDQRAAILQDRFIRSPNTRALTDLLSFASANDRAFPIENAQVQASLFDLGDWHIDRQYLEKLFRCVEGYLFTNVGQTSATRWARWLAESRRVGRYVDALNPIVAGALLNASLAGKLSSVSKEDYGYLLRSYLRQYGELLKRTPSSESRALQVLVEYAAIAQVVGHDASYPEVGQPWSRHPFTPPRSLTSLTDEQASQAPHQGVGSPHRVTITFYHDLSTGFPLQLTYAGVTGDATLNSQIFTSLFALALAGDSERTFLTSQAGNLSLPSPSLPVRAERPPAMGAFVVGPAGPVEPVSQMPTLGMDISEALLLITGTFESYQKNTGLVQTQHCQVANPEELSETIRDALSRPQREPVIIRSTPSWSADADGVQAMPLLRRDETGAAVPLEIEVPFHLLGATRIATLLANARQGYMEQLIRTSIQRQAFAQQVYDVQDQLVRYWEASSSEEKAAVIVQSPIVTIENAVDFERGLQIPLDPPQTESRENYETVTRPRLRDSARRSAEAFRALVDKLASLNVPGGKADQLTFKLLVDSMIRQASLPMAYPEFQSEYRNWVEVCALPTWALIRSWAEKIGLRPEILAADHVVFHARLQTNPQRVVLQPWVFIDRDDFAIRVDCQKGLVDVGPGRQPAALADMVVPSPEHGITNLRSLYDRFCAWAKGVPCLRDSPGVRRAAMRAAVWYQVRSLPLVQLYRARQYILHGEAAQAGELLDGLRDLNLAPVCYWRAVVHQYQSIANDSDLLREILRLLRQETYSDFYVDIPTGERLQQTLDHVDGVDKEQVTAFILALSCLALAEFAGTLMTEVPQRQYRTDAAAESEIRALYVRYPAYIRGLLQNQPQGELDRESLELTPDDEAGFLAVADAVTSLDLLDLAECTKDMARSLPYGGGAALEVKRVWDALVSKRRLLAFSDISIDRQLKTLSRLVANELGRLARSDTQTAPVSEGTSKKLAQSEIAPLCNPSLYQEILDLFSQFASEFGCHASVRTLFSQAPLNIWYDQLPEELSVVSRQIALLDFLSHAYHPETRENGLILFLRSLSDQCQLGDERQQELRRLAGRLGEALSSLEPYDRDITDAFLASRQLVLGAPGAPVRLDSQGSGVAAWDLATIKHNLHALSELTAQTAVSMMANASKLVSQEHLALLIPLAVEMRWSRGYAVGLNRLIQTATTYKFLGEFSLEISSPPCPLTEGLLSAEITSAGQILVQLDGQPMAMIKDVAQADAEMIRDTVNGYGRLEALEEPGLSMMERLGALPMVPLADAEAIKEALSLNLSALIPLVARWGMPGADWLLPSDEVFSDVPARPRAG